MDSSCRIKLAMTRARIQTGCLGILVALHFAAFAGPPQGGADSDESRFFSAQLVAIARDLKRQPIESGAIDTVRAIQRAAQSAEVRRRASLLEILLTLEDAGSDKLLRASEERLRSLTATDLNNWEAYLAKFCACAIKAKRHNYTDALASIDWLLANYSVLDNARKLDAFCEAVCRGLEKGRGSLRDGILDSKAAILHQLGKDDEARAIYQNLAQGQGNQDTVWSRGARNSLRQIDESTKKRAKPRPGDADAPVQSTQTDEQGN